MRLCKREPEEDDEKETAERVKDGHAGAAHHLRDHAEDGERNGLHHPGQHLHDGLIDGGDDVLDRGKARAPIFHPAQSRPAQQPE